MKNLSRPFFLISVVLFGCGGSGGGHSSVPPQSVASEAPGASANNFNDGLTGKLYYNGVYAYRELDLATGKIRDLHRKNLDGPSMPNRDATEFVQDYNETAGGYYRNEDMVFYNSDSQEIGRREMKGDIGEIRFSPDSRFVLFSWSSDRIGASELVVMERYGTWERNFGQVNTRAYDWSPDGKIVFCNDKNLFIVDDFQTSEPVIVSATSNNVYHLNVSPDGTKLAFSGSPGGLNEGHIYVMGIDGRDVYQVTTSSLWEHSVAWSPDGEYLALIRGESYTNVPGDGYFSDPSTEGNITPRVFVVKAGSNMVDLNGQYPAGAISVQHIEGGDTFRTTAFSDLAWRAGN